MKNKCIFRYNNGNLAILCSKCSVIIKRGRDFTEDEIKAMKGKINMLPQYCDKCKEIKYYIIMTAEEFFKEELGYECRLDEADAMIKFAKIHVEAALRAAIEKLPHEDKMNRGILPLDKLLNCYPLNLIK